MAESFLLRHLSIVRWAIIRIMLARFACQHTPKLTINCEGYCYLFMSNQYSTLIRVRELHTLINLHITAQLDFN